MVFWAFFSTREIYAAINKCFPLSYTLFPLNDRIETCFHNFLNQSSIDDANIWNYCQLFTTTNNAASSTIIGSKSRNISNLEILPNCLTKKKRKKKSLRMLPQVHGSVCFPPTQLKLVYYLLLRNAVPWFACLFLTSLLSSYSPIFTEFSALCYFLSTPVPSGCRSHNIIWGQRVNLILLTILESHHWKKESWN